MRIIRTSVLLLLVATSASARRHSIGWPLQLLSCVGGVVTSAPGIVDFAVNGGFVYFVDDSGEVQRVAKDGGATPTILARIPAETLWMEVDATRVYPGTAAR
jgi:hypothetical protein